MSRTRSKTKKRPARPSAASTTGAARDLAKPADRALAANRRQGEDALALIGRRIVAIAESFFDIGEALTILARKEIYSALGHRSFEDLLDKRDLMSRATAAELIRISGRYSRETAVALGREKANALLRFVDASKELDVAEQLARADAKLRGAGGPVSEVTAAAIEQAARALRDARATTRTARSPEERAAVAAARSLQATLRKAGARHATAVARRHDSAWIIRAELEPAVAARLVVASRRRR